MSPNPQISVVIPTYNRRDALRSTLLALAGQSIPPDSYEVILVDDGSTEDILGMVSSLDLDCPLSFYRQTNRGPAAARNLGAQKALGAVLLFLDNDMIAAPGLLEAHLCSHQTPNRLVVGPRSHYPSDGDEDHLSRFDYRSDGTDLRLDKQPLTFQEAFTCNFSISAANWQRLGGFDESFPTASFEDIEFAYRAVKAGLLIYLNRDALAYHNHDISMQDRCARAFSYTKTVPLLYAKHPELRGQIEHLHDKEPFDFKSDPLPLVFRKFTRRLLTQPWAIEFMKVVFTFSMNSFNYSAFSEFWYWKIIGSYQYLGMQEGIKFYGWDENTGKYADTLA